MWAGLTSKMSTSIDTSSRCVDFLFVRCHASQPLPDCSRRVHRIVSRLKHGASSAVSLGARGAQVAPTLVFELTF